MVVVVGGMNGHQASSLRRVSPITISICQTGDDVGSKSSQVVVDHFSFITTSVSLRKSTIFLRLKVQTEFVSS